MKKKTKKQKNNRLNLRAKKNKLLPKLPPCQCNSNILKGIPLFETHLITNTIQPREVKKKEQS